MKIIDEKGRLFGKINVIDFLIILFLLSLTPMFYFGYKIFNNKPPEVKAERQPKERQPKEFIIMINCKFVNLKPEVLKMISVGDKERDSKENLIGEIVSLGKPSPYTYAYNIGQTLKLIRTDPELQQIAATLKINAAVIGKNIYYNDKQILEGNTLQFSTKQYSLELEDISIIEDNHSQVLDSALRYASDKKEIIDTISVELRAWLTTLNSSIELVSYRVGQIEEKMKKKR